MKVRWLVVGISDATDIACGCWITGLVKGR